MHKHKISAALITFNEEQNIARTLEKLVWCDEIVVVDVPETVQIERTMARDENSRSQVESIMAAQMTREARREKASRVINNDQDLVSLYEQVETLHRELLQK